MELITNIVSNAKYQFNWKSEFGPVMIGIKIPDLTNLKYSILGDWGPMYTFELDETERVVINYDNNTYESIQTSLRIDSPILAIEREVHPHFLIIEDFKKCKSYHIYLNASGELGKVQVIDTRDTVTSLQKVEENPYQNQI